MQLFRVQLLNDIRQVLQLAQPQPVKQWLKNSEVMKLMKISANTIQRLPVAGKLKSSKIGGVHYYRYEDIQSLLENGL